MSYEGVSLGPARAIRESESGKALYVACKEAPKGSKKGIWVPLSAIHDDSDIYEPGHSGKLVIKYWFAEQKNWV